MAGASRPVPRPSRHPLLLSSLARPSGTNQIIVKVSQEGPPKSADGEPSGIRTRITAGSRVNISRADRQSVNVGPNDGNA